MLKYLVPRIAMVDLPPMIGVALIGAIVAGLYGILHDQITFSISPEYFTKQKFPQFWYADLGFGDRFFVSTIGFLATWWVGLIIGWFLARRLLPSQSRAKAFRQISAGFACVILLGVLSGLFGYAYGLWCGPRADYSSWEWVIKKHQISDTWSFVRVAYIHYASYLGGLVGMIVALIAIRPSRMDRCNG